MKNIDVALIYKLWHEYTAAVNDSDLERWASLWVGEGIQMPPGVPRRVGKEQIWRGMQPLFAHCHISKMIIQPEEIRIVGHWAYVHGTYEIESTPKGDGEAKRFSGKFLDIVEKQADGSWKIVIDCYNFNAPLEKFIAVPGKEIKRVGIC